MKTRMISLCLLILMAACGTKVEEVDNTGDTVEDVAPLQQPPGRHPRNRCFTIYIRTEKQN